MKFTLRIQKVLLTVLATSSIFLLLPQEASARGGGGGSGMAVGFLISSTSANQSGVNSVAAANGGGDMSSALEFMPEGEMRFSTSMFAILFRPSYFTQTQSKGSLSYSLTGFTLMPMLRLYPLENSFIKFFMQAGLGFGSLTGDLTNSSSSVKFSGSAMGYSAGLGANFCFTDSHCLVIEGNYRYLPIERNVASSASGTVTGLTQATANKEVEDSNGNDMSTTMSGVQGIIGYRMNF